MTKNKFIYLISIFLIIGIISTAVNAKATNPEHFNIDYDYDTDTLEIYIVHGVTYPDEHYVNYIEIQIINGSQVVTQTVTDTFTEQETYNINFYSYTVVAEWGDDSSTGDKIRVIATCNLGGYFEKTLPLFPRPATHEFAFVSVVPAFILGTLIASAFAVLPILLMKKHREMWMLKRKQQKLETQIT